jgi:hypothetical protein
LQRGSYGVLTASALGVDRGAIPDARGHLRRVCVVYLPCLYRGDRRQGGPLQRRGESPGLVGQQHPEFALRLGSGGHLVTQEGHLRRQLLPLALECRHQFTLEIHPARRPVDGARSPVGRVWRSGLPLGGGAEVSRDARAAVPATSAGRFTFYSALPRRTGPAMRFTVPGPATQRCCGAEVAHPFVDNVAGRRTLGP